MAQPQIFHGLTVEMRELLEGLVELAAEGTLQIPRVPERMTIGFDEAKHEYRIDGVKVPSVTQINDATVPKPALNWWHFRVGLAGVVRLLADNNISYGMLQTSDPDNIIRPQAGHPDSVLRGKGARAKWKSRLEKACQDAQHDPYNVVNRKGTTGTSVHDAAERLPAGTSAPSELYPEEDRVYIDALNAYFDEQEPDVEHIEQIVASKRFQYAGRFDTIIRTSRGTLRGRDYKTSNGVYPEMDMQMSGYDLAWREMGREPLEGWDLVWLRDDGTYEIVPCTVNHADFLVRLLAYHQTLDLTRRVKALGRDT